ncbi:Ku protein [Streptomyces spiralis]
MGEGYYLAPSERVAAKPYKLLVQALSRSSRVAVAKWAWHGRERLGLLRVRDDVLVMHVMRWPDEIRDPAELLPPTVEVSEDEIKGALALMDTMTVDALEGPDFVDHYTEALEQVIEAKRDHREPPKVPEAEPGRVLDLMAALNASVQKAKQARGEGQEAEVREMPAPKKKAAKKQPAKKAAAKKTTGKKTAGRRPRSA